MQYSSGRYMSVSDEISNWMMMNITEGIWKEGEKIPSENELCKLFGVSRISVRAAIKMLQGQGFLVTRPGIGSFISLPRERLGPSSRKLIARLTDTECLEFVEFRHTIEGKAVELFARNALLEDQAVLKSALECMYATYQNEKQFIKNDLDFHYAILKGAHNQYLLSAMEANNNVLESYFETVHASIDTENRMGVCERHSAICTDLLNKNASSARKRLNTEITYYYVELFQTIKEEM